MPRDRLGASLDAPGVMWCLLSTSVNIVLQHSTFIGTFQGQPVRDHNAVNLDVSKACIIVARLFNYSAFIRFIMSIGEKSTKPIV